MSSIKLYYDGNCPFCKEYSKYIKLKQKHDVQVLNARDKQEDIKRFKELGFDINDGFIIELDKDGEIYIGADAVKILDAMIKKESILDKILSIIVNRSIFKTIIYPIVKIIRKVLLKFLKIDSRI